MRILRGLSLTLALLMLSASPRVRTVGFDSQPAGGPPAGFTCAHTGNGRDGQWLVVPDPAAPSPPNALAQMDQDETAYRFPVCVMDSVSAADVEISVRFKPLRGKVDQGAGIVWRYLDTDNYYVLRANALENNVVLYKVEGGVRRDLDPKGSGPFAYGRRTTIEPGVWSTLRVDVTGSVFEAFLDGERLFEVEDSTFSKAGKVGVWTKADSVSYFDDLRVVLK